MIIEYHRPDSLAEALKLLTRDTPVTKVLGGGTIINRPSKEEFAVVDLVNLELDNFEVKGSTVELGASLRLVDLLERLKSVEFELKETLLKMIEREGSHNLRQVATVAGALVSANGRSAFAQALMALDATLTLEPGSEKISLGDLLLLRDEILRGRLITFVSFPGNVQLSYKYVSRSPADWSIVSAALCVWPSGRTRLALSGYGEGPLIAFDGGSADGLESAAMNAYAHANDEWASAEYRSEIAGILASRCYQEIAG